MKSVLCTTVFDITELVANPWICKRSVLASYIVRSYSNFLILKFFKIFVLILTAVIGGRNTEILFLLFRKCWNWGRERLRDLSHRSNQRLSYLHLVLALFVKTFQLLLQFLFLFLFSFSSFFFLVVY